MARKGNGGVLPAGTLPPRASIKKGIHTITVKYTQPDGGKGVYAGCVYPDGWVKDHQVLPTAIDDLFLKIVGQLRGRYGAVEVKLLEAPKAVKEGATLKVEVV